MRIGGHHIASLREGTELPRGIEATTMAELKTKPTTVRVTDFLESVDDEERRKDCFSVVKIMQKATGAKPKMWGPSIVGFGDYRYTNSRGQGTDWFLIGFSPRKTDLTLYIMPGSARHGELLKTLGVDISRMDLKAFLKQLGYDLPSIDMRSVKAQCRQAQGELDRLATSEIGRLRNELLVCEDSI